MAYNSFSSMGNGIIPQQSSLPPPPNPPIGLTGPPLPSTMPMQPLNPDQQQQQQAFQQMQQLQEQYNQQMQHLQQCMNPAMNDSPLEFNTRFKKNNPPMPTVHEQSSNNGKDHMREDDGDRRDRRDRRHGRDRRDRRDRDNSEHQKSNSRDGFEAQNMQGPPQPMNSNMPPMMPMGDMMGPMMGGMMPMMDPSAIMDLRQFGMMPGMMPDGAGMGNMLNQDANMYPQRTMLQFKDCTLVAPSPNAPAPATRERPPGCRTVYVGGLPDNITEEILQDVFSRCGEMISIRLNIKKNFCHIRFEAEASVDAALFYSGYRLRIGNKADMPNTGRLHVDYAQARVDQYEHECKQRAQVREQRHRERVERERMRPVSPPAVPHYSDIEATDIAESMKTNDGFKKSSCTVVAWLERGDLSKRNANMFYSMLQSTYSHVRRLVNEKMQFDEELRAAKDLHRARVATIIGQFESIEKVFMCAAHKKCWDHFTKAQRKNIEAWKKQSLEIKQLQFDGLNEDGDDEMDVSDDDQGPNKKRAKTDVNALKEENDALKCQLEAYKNEVDMVKADMMVDLDERDKRIKVLQQTVQNMSNELTGSSTKLIQEKELVRQLKSKMTANEGQIETDAQAAASKENKQAASATQGGLGENDAKLIGLISTFLHVHPFGAGVDYIWSYLSKLDMTVTVSEVEALMARLPGVFRQELCGIGATLERRWIFTGFSLPKK